MLFSELEVQKRAHGHERPPILKAPGLEGIAVSDAMTTSAEVKP
jgi:hypothetical protein